MQAGRPRGGRRRRGALGVVCVCAASVAVAACSNQQPSINRRPHTGSSTAAEVGGVQQLTVTAGDTYRFDPSTITVHPGPVQITFTNVGKGAPHNLTFLSFMAATPLTTAGQTSQLSFTAPSPGSYTFVCTIHRAQGQTGTLVVLPR